MMVNRTRFSRVITCRSGASAAEFALILPLLLLLILGTLQVSMMMFSYNVMVSTARDTTRSMAVCTINDIATGKSDALKSLMATVPWVQQGEWSINPVIEGNTPGSIVSMTISVDPAKAAILSYIPFSIGMLTSHVVMIKEPLVFGGC